VIVFELKLLSREGIPAALSKAERYRFFNQPAEAESIYLDILQVEPDNQEALVGLLLSLTDQFDHGLPGTLHHARELLPRIRDEYERSYYAGIICERRAKALLQHARAGVGGVAYDLLFEARRWYEQAEQLRPPGNDDVLLRWNACARLMMRHPEIAAAPRERTEQYADT
jgi:hypothetical protein